jgi:hypothetical protein
VPERGDRDVDEIGLDLAHARLVDTEPLDDAGAEVLHQHVRAPHQQLEELAAARVLQVQHDRALAAIARREHRRHPAARRPHVAPHVAEPGRFDLDHLRALIGEDHGGEWAGDVRGQVDDPEAL